MNPRVALMLGVVLGTVLTLLFVIGVFGWFTTFEGGLNGIR